MKKLIFLLLTLFTSFSALAKAVPDCKTQLALEDKNINSPENVTKNIDAISAITNFLDLDPHDSAMPQGDIGTAIPMTYEPAYTQSLKLARVVSYSYSIGKNGNLDSERNYLILSIDGAVRSRPSILDDGVQNHASFFLRPGKTRVLTTSSEYGEGVKDLKVIAAADGSYGKSVLTLQLHRDEVGRVSISISETTDTESYYLIPLPGQREVKIPAPKVRRNAKAVLSRIAH